MTERDEIPRSEEAHSEEAATPMQKDTVKEWIHAFVEALILFFIMYLVFWPVKIDGSSMEDTFYTGERAIMCRVLAMADFYHRGDIVVCTVEVHGKRQNVIKRVIGVAGDHIEIHDGAVWVNGSVLDEPYALGMTHGDIDVVLGPEDVYILGDNRSYSIDSREIGPVSQSEVKGKVFLRLWPLNRIQLF